MQSSWKTQIAGYLPDRWVLFYNRKLQGTPEVALTFDDGPHPENTPRILDSLQKHGCKASFFVLGWAAKKYPDLIRRMHDAGHTLGNHSYSHHQFGDLPWKKQLEEVENTQKALAEITGEVPRWFRPPQGRMSFCLLPSLIRQGLTIAFWSRDSMDWKFKDATSLHEFLINTPSKNGEILLFHDDMAVTTEVIPDFLVYLKKNDHRCVSLDEWKKVV